MWIDSHILFDPDLKPTEKLLMTEIINLCKLGTNYASDRHYKDITGLSNAGVNKALKLLQSKGYISYDTKYAGKRALGKTITVVCKKVYTVDGNKVTIDGNKVTIDDGNKVTIDDGNLVHTDGNKVDIDGNLVGPMMVTKLPPNGNKVSTNSISNNSGSNKAFNNSANTAGDNTDVVAIPVNNAEEDYIDDLAIKYMHYLFPNNEQCCMLPGYNNPRMDVEADYAEDANALLQDTIKYIPALKEVLTNSLQWLKNNPHSVEKAKLTANQIRTNYKISKQNSYDN